MVRHMETNKDPFSSPEFSHGLQHMLLRTVAERLAEVGYQLSSVLALTGESAGNMICGGSPDDKHPDHPKGLPPFMVVMASGAEPAKLLQEWAAAYAKDMAEKAKNGQGMPGTDLMVSSLVEGKGIEATIGQDGELLHKRKVGEEGSGRG